MKTLAALALVVGALLALPSVTGAHNEDHKVFVCKYVGPPGEDERLQTGDNPISVDVHSIDAFKDFDGDVDDLVGKSFADKQGRSLVIAVDRGQDEPECPTDEVEPTPTPTPAPTETPTPTETPVPTPTEPVVTFSPTPPGGVDTGGGIPGPTTRPLPSTDTVSAVDAIGIPLGIVVVVLVSAGGLGYVAMTRRVR